MRKKKNQPKREYVQPQRIITWDEFLIHLSVLKNYSEQTKCHVAMTAAIMSNQRHNSDTGFLDFLPDTPQWVRDLDVAMYHLTADGIFAKMSDRYQAGKAALAKYFDVNSCRDFCRQKWRKELDKQSFRDFVYDMVQYLDGQWRIEEKEGHDYLVLRGEGIAKLHAYNQGDRVGVDGQFELFKDWRENDQFGRCFVHREDRCSVSHPMTSARRAAARVNGMLPAYHAALERTMERYRRHEERLAIARRNAEAIVQASGGALKLGNEDYGRGRIQVIGRRDDSPLSVEFYVDENRAQTDRYWDVPFELAIVIAEWIGQHRKQRSETRII